MRVLVTGASGNVGTQVLAALLAEPDTTVVGLCRRPPAAADLRAEWVATDLSRPESADVVRRAAAGADAVVHLAWTIAKSHTPDYMHAVNVDGSRRVFNAAVDAGVPAIVHASSVGAYSKGPKDRRVDESWPTDGVPTSTYSREKAEVERMLDRLEAEYPQLRVVRLRTGLIFQRQAASEIARYFLGHLVPLTLVRRDLIPIVPRINRLLLQAVHAADAGTAYRLAVTREVRGAFNIAAEPVLDPPALGRLLGATPVPLPAAPVRAVVDLTWRAHLQPTEPGWFDLGRDVPLMDTTRARTELGWQPAYDAGQALLELLDGMSDRAGGPTPVLHARPSMVGLLRGLLPRG